MIRKLFFTAFLGAAFYSNAQTVVFQEDFESPAARALWTIGDRDADTQSWEYLDAGVNEVDSFQGFFATSFSWFLEAFTPDNTLTSPAIFLPATGSLQLNFKVAAGDDELFQEHYAVYVIPATSAFTGAEIPVFEETLDGGYLAAAKIINIDISAYSGQNVKLVFRHYDCEDIFYVGIDDVKITQNILAVGNAENNQIKIYPNPSSEYINIENVSDFKTARIFDFSGKLVKQSASKQIDVSSLSAGQYILNIYSGTDIISRKFIKK